MKSMTVTKSDGTIVELRMKSSKSNIVDEVPEIQKKSLPIIMRVENIPKTKIKFNEKRPMTERWQQSTKTNMKPTNKTNVGIICSPRTGVCAVDLDFYTKEGEEKYDPINNPKHKLFIDKFGKDFIKRFDTYSQATPNGGIHLLFQHNKEFQQTSKKQYKIDTRGGSTSGQILMAGSTFNNKKYTILNNTDIKPIPDDLLEFLKVNIFKKYPSSTQSNAVKSSRKNKYAITDYKYKYDYDVPEKHLHRLLKILFKEDPTYYTDRNNWLVFTSAMKQIGHKALWDEYSELYGGASYNKFKNLIEWDNIILKDNRNETSFYFEELLKVISLGKDIKYYRMLKLPKDTHKKLYSRINVDKLSKMLDLNNGKKFWCIKSDTGTGKTTLFKKLIEETQCELVSITSRTCLAFEQCEDFNKIADGDCNFYQYTCDDENAQVQTICIDSLLRIKDWDFSNKVIFLDEFNSIIEYLISCETSTLSKNREDIFRLLIDTVLMTAKMIVCVDADICDLSIEYLKEVEKRRNINFNFIQNDFLHNNGNTATEIHEHNEFISKVWKEDMYLLACDSKDKAKALWEELTQIDKALIQRNKDFGIEMDTREPIKLIIAEDKCVKTEFIRLNEHKRVIYSPKIVYGLDSNGFGENQLPRPVFAYYNMKSISPKAMLQQLNRERKITHLYFLIYQKTVRNDIIQNEHIFTESVLEQNKHSLKLFGRLSSINNDLFVKLLHIYKYKENCYHSNKYLHLINLLKNRGWVITNEYLTIGERTAELTQHSKELKEKFNSEQYSLSDHLNSKLNIQLFNFETEEGLQPYADYFTDNNLVIKHISLMNLFFTSKQSLENNLAMSNDFSIIKLTNYKSKHLFIRKLLDIFGMDKWFTKISEPKEFNQTDIIKEYKTMWNDRTSSPIPMLLFYDKLKFIAKIYESMKIPLVKKRYTVNGVKMTDYKIDTVELAKCETILTFNRNNKPDDVFLD
jgi:hypothetical protein